MQLKPNRSVIRGTVTRIVPAADGVGAEIVVAVETAAPAEGSEAFVAAAPGAEISLFAAVPGELALGESYEIDASLLGGPGGTRAVIESARPRPKE